MTEVEKRFNKEDLKAYKGYDNTQYSLIPGIQGKKQFYDRTKIKVKPNISFDEKKRRMEAFGYQRYENKNQSLNNSHIVVPTHPRIDPRAEKRDVTENLNKSVDQIQPPQVSSRSS